MTSPSSTVPLRRAVERALTQPTGQTRALSHARLFTLTFPAEVVYRPELTIERKCCYVECYGHRDAVGVLEVGPVVREIVGVRVACWYYAGSELMRDEHERALRELDEDRLLVRAALCYPGVLLYDPDGNDTGLDGGSLRADEWTSDGPTPLPATEGQARVLRVVHSFRTTVELTQPT